MSDSREIDQIDALLREEAARVDDAGFTERVVKSLPPRRRAGWRMGLLLGVTAAGSLLAVVWFPWESLPALNAPGLRSLRVQDLLPWGFAMAVSGSIAWSGMVALQRED